MRYALLPLALLLGTATARADRIALIATPVERALSVPIVVTGKVASIEKDTVDAPLYAGASQKVAHKIAVVKIESNLKGAAGVTHLRIGFVPAGAAGIRSGRGPENPVLAQGQEWLFFLVKNPTGEFHSIPYMTPPLDSKAANYKAQIESIRSIVAVLAEPKKALAAEKAGDRFRAAIALVLGYRSNSLDGRAVETVPLALDESQLILRTLASGSWKLDPTGGRFNGLTAFFQLGLGEPDGWKYPNVQPGEDAAEVMQKAFIQWLEGPGKDYRIKKLVPKKN